MKLVQNPEAKSDDTATTINQIPPTAEAFEYTKVDKIIDILFTTAADVESQQEDERIEPSLNTEEAEEPQVQTQEKTDRALIEEMRDRAIKGFSHMKGTQSVRRNRCYFWSSDKRLRASCTVSKRYDKEYQPYWYAYHLKWDEFLKEGDGYLILGCTGFGLGLRRPQRCFAENAKSLNVTERDDGKSYWHIPLAPLDGGGLGINLSKAGRKYSLEPRRFPLTAAG